MPPVGFEPTISVGERPQTYALNRAATGTGISKHLQCRNKQYVYLAGYMNTNKTLRRLHIRCTTETCLAITRQREKYLAQFPCTIKAK